jgi:hypothetical protein
VAPRSTQQAGTLSATSLRKLAIEHPDAVVDFSVVSGRRGQLSLTEFIETRRAAGIGYIRVVSQGKIIAQGFQLAQ